MITAFATLLFAVAATAWAPVQEVDIQQYLGHWYQAYSDLAVTATFENSSYCVTADYGLNTNGTISVWNRERQYSVDGPERQIFGWAQASNESAPGELTVHLQGTGSSQDRSCDSTNASCITAGSATSSSFGAPYWIFELGPPVPGPNNTAEYAYSVVSDPFHLTLFVLARNLTEFAANWSAGVLERLAAAGYTNFLNTPIATVQEGCVPY